MLCVKSSQPRRDLIGEQLDAAICLCVGHEASSAHGHEMSKSTNLLMEG